jgi:hypothetical protein
MAELEILLEESIFKIEIRLYTWIVISAKNKIIMTQIIFLLKILFFDNPLQIKNIKPKSTNISIGSYI